METVSCVLELILYGLVRFGRPGPARSSMSWAKLDNIRSIRRSLAKSQSELADMLHISVRTVQSYEQGRRNIPPRVQELAGVLLYLERRREQRKLQPCWEIRNCHPSVRGECRAYQLEAGDFCWLVTGNDCGDQKLESRGAKLEKCGQCPVTKQWLAS